MCLSSLAKEVDPLSNTDTGFVPSSVLYLHPIASYMRLAPVGKSSCARFCDKEVILEAERMGPDSLQ